MIKHKKTLSEKISELINPNPVWEDPENEFSETTAKVVENSSEYIDDEDVPRSTLKLSQCALLDEEDNKYVGKKVSRRSYEKESLNSSTKSTEVDVRINSEDETAGSQTSSITSVLEEDGSESEYEDAGSNQSSSEEDFKSFDGTQGPHAEDCSFKNIMSYNYSADLEKANAVRNQIRLWDNLLETRIQLQKCLVAANKLPQHDSFDSFQSLAGSEFQTQVTLCKEEGLGFLEKLMELQHRLLQSNSETREVYSGKPRKEDNEVQSDSDEEGSSIPDVNDKNGIPKKRRKLSEFSKDITQQDTYFKKYRNDTLEKWYARSKVVNAKSSNFSAFDLSILKQIEHVLCNTDSLIKRTQKKRSCYRQFGAPLPTEAKEDQESKVEEEFDSEIYDDDDFYHKLLRELIERKTANVTDPVQLGRQWTELQKLRRKLKKKVDTKASKGRKMRYVVHSKLVNYMAPVPYRWSDSAMDDFFRSLFGKAE